MRGALLTPPGTIPPTYCPNAVMFATIFAILILVLAGWAIAKNYDAKVVLFAAGFLLMYAALIMGSDAVPVKMPPDSPGRIPSRPSRIFSSSSTPTRVSSS